MVNFLYQEAEMLDERKYKDWFSLLTDDVNYKVYLVDFTSNAELIPILDEDKVSLERRVNRLFVETAWAENPPSHTMRTVSNIMIIDRKDRSYIVKSNLIFYRDRGDLSPEMIFARRKDEIVKDNERFKIRYREVIIQDTILKARNLSFIL
ncbi:aromatic-ring-hydroxylating dioxygenase subunit beta [Sulfolobus acidocaldarius SUSAZ]|nr:aromatic-ring-hydroxylating dioxygenase subunit beta [Sulfolobus acidocaldarius SUSAZ]